MKPEEFERTDGPILSDEGFVYEAWEAARGVLCPECGSGSCVIKAHYTAELRLRSDILKKEVLIDIGSNTCVRHAARRSPSP